MAETSEDGTARHSTAMTDAVQKVAHKAQKVAFAYCVVREAFLYHYLAGNFLYLQNRGAEMNDDLQKLLARATADVPEVGRLIFNLSRNASYDAAKRGDIPTIKVGRLLKVPTAALRKQLGLEAA